MTFRTFVSLATAVLVAALAAETALAGSITAASGPIEVNGKQVTLDPGKPLVLKPGDRVDTGGSTATWTSTGGDTVALEPDSGVTSTGEESGVDSLFMRYGTAVADLSPKTTFGAAAGWVTVPAGVTAKSQVFVEAPRGTSAAEALFRSNSGDVWVSYHQYNVWLPQRHAVTLSIDQKAPGLVCFRTHQQNPSDVHVRKTVAGGTITSRVPRATSGCVEPVEGGRRTKITNDITSFKTGKVVIETDFAAGSDTAELGPGTHALIDNKTGAISLFFATTEYEILARSIDLTSEFETLSQSNFTQLAGSGSGSSSSPSGGGGPPPDED